MFFAWFYNPESTYIQTNYYDREKVLAKYYDGDYINTIFGRYIQVSSWKAFNYLIQSTAADLVIDRAIAIEKMLEDRKSSISHIVHDEVVIDFALEDRELLKEIKNTFAANKVLEMAPQPLRRNSMIFRNIMYICLMTKSRETPAENAN